MNSGEVTAGVVKPSDVRTIAAIPVNTAESDTKFVEIKRQNEVPFIILGKLS